jgi:hypothetical protein
MKHIRPTNVGVWAYLGHSLPAAPVFLGIAVFLQGMPFNKVMEISLAGMKG